MLPSRKDYIDSLQGYDLEALAIHTTYRYDTLESVFAIVGDMDEVREIVADAQMANTTLEGVLAVRRLNDARRRKNDVDNTKKE
ncbi:MAG: hypothetical protein KAI84_06740 [Gammaproteobacteria bacterium]|nr:hypothetical protein [Gammaproteobacteria bacterium]